MTTRIATLNIRHGGRKNGDALINRLLGYDADILVVTEFRANDVGARLIARLTSAGYATSQPDAGPKHNSVLIASRRGIDRSWAFDRDGLDPRHLWCAEIDGVVLCGVYMPQRTEKLPYWEALIGDARRDGVDLLVGDFNTGNNDLDKDPQGAKFIGPEMPGRLTATGYTDVWRSLHPAAREYSWFSRPGDNGFRLDYLFAVPDLARQVSACTFDHAPRITGETDHSGLVASLG
ncbi:endonuclease/exonuclease/phosphatase family protein [Mycolicibacterium mageritense]|uniref:endonuclease/exonuclease/phosphatase family protein n=1 Tax=Mycolicibacterium mageritense TaxID=53462 RepID=UPI00093E8E82|nr:endonuclease/exonuclease/phosphatase family protein [Mycolicibacterium mageritense]OKH62415.1 exonuclease III [Mycobacterium sp. SWH-M3]GJJ24137.1 endonuclease [Mycolicibacterium mageritense]